MIIQGAAPKNIDAIPSSTSQSKMKKRGKVKNYSRRQLLLKQKAVMDKMLHVDARIEDLQNVFSGMELDRQQKIGASRAGRQVECLVSIIHNKSQVCPLYVTFSLPQRRKWSFWHLKVAMKGLQTVWWIKEIRKFSKNRKTS